MTVSGSTRRAGRWLMVAAVAASILACAEDELAGAAPDASPSPDAVGPADATDAAPRPDAEPDVDADPADAAPADAVPTDAAPTDADPPPDRGPGEDAAPPCEPTDEICESGLDEDCDGSADEGDCLRPCAARDDCPQPGLCVDGRCLDGECRDDADCPGGLCAERLCLLAACDRDAECGPGRHCAEDGCAPLPPACRDATPIGPGAYEGDTTGEANDFEASCGGGARSPDRAYRLDFGGYVGPACVNLHGTAYSHVMHARRRCPDPASELGCDFDGRDGPVQVDVAPDAPVYAIVDGYVGDSSGRYVLWVDEGPCPCAACAEGEVCRLGRCVAPACGDGVVDGDEGCDPGEGHDPLCDANCQPVRGSRCQSGLALCDAGLGVFGQLASAPGEPLPELDFGPGGEPLPESCPEDVFLAALAFGFGPDPADAPVGFGVGCSQPRFDGRRMIVDRRSPPMLAGPPTPDSVVIAECPLSHLPVGYHATPGAGLALICRPLELVDGRTALGPPVESAPVPLPVAAEQRAACPGDTVLSGSVTGRYDDALRSVALRCAALVDICRDAGEPCEQIGDCVDDADCAGGASCVDFHCREGACRAHADCPPDARCLDGRCVEGGCEHDIDCGPGAGCSPFFGLCGPFRCADDDDCGAGAVCGEGFWCAAGGCWRDGQCAPGAACLDGACVGDCERDGQCADGRVCSNRVCTPPEVCDDGVGNNGNGQVDCLEASCAEHPACRQATCIDDVDCPSGRCIGRLCAEPEDAPLAIGRPGWRVRTTGTVSRERPIWQRPDEGCAGDGPVVRAMWAARTVTNDGPTAARITATLYWEPIRSGGRVSGFLHVFEHPFDVERAPEGCVVGDAELADIDTQQITGIELAPGQSRALVLSVGEVSDEGTYILEVVTESPPETCRGGLDEDDDGAIDCADPDCAADPACRP